MQRLFILFFLCTFELTGCSLFGAIHSDTKPIDAADLSIKHIYKAPAKNKQHPSALADPQLNQLITVALTDAPDMHSAKARIQRAQNVAKGAYSALWPAVNLNGYEQGQHVALSGVLPQALNIPGLANLTFNVADIALNFNYEIDFWGKNRENFASRLGEVYAAQMDLAQTQLVLSTAVATEYFELQNNITQFHLAKENVRLQKQLSDIVTDRAKQGIESDIPVKTAIADTQSALLSVENYKDAQMQSQHRLAALLGKNPFTTHINASKTLYHKPILPPVIPANVLAQRPDIRATRSLTEAAAHQVNVAKANFFPNINLTGLLSLQNAYFNKLFHINIKHNEITGAMNLPVFDAGARRANLGVRYAEYELAVNQYNQTILTALKQVADQLSALQILDAQLTSQNKAVNATQSNYKLFRSRYTHGIIDYVQLIEIKQLLLQQRATLLNLQTRQMQAHVALLAALGGEVFYDRNK